MNDKEIINSMVDDIKYLEDLGLDGEEIWDNFKPSDYGNNATDYHKKKAFEKCGYTVD